MKIRRMKDHQIDELVLHKRSKTLELVMRGGESHSLTAKYLRVHSPSAEVKGHGNPRLMSGKSQVGIDKLEPVGHYGVRISFDDGHDTGLYTWLYLTDLAMNQDTLWQSYIHKLEAAGLSTDPEQSAVRWVPNNHS